MAILTSRSQASGVTLNDLIHIVITSDQSQNPAGSSYKATIGQVFDSLSSYTFTNLSVNGNLNVSGNTILNNVITNTLSATTYLGLPGDIFITGGTFDKNTETLTLERSSGSSITITGFADYFTTGTTLIGDILYFDRNDMLSAYSVSLSSFTPSEDTYVTGFTYDDANTITLSQSNGQSSGVTLNTFTGLTINGGLSATSISADTYYNLPPFTGTNFINVTYDELYTKVTTDLLEPNRWYRLTDYKSVNFLNGWEVANLNSNLNGSSPTYPSFVPREIYTGETEVLLLQALTTNSISPIGYSETYPQDVIQYEPYTNKIGVSYSITNGGTLPNSAITTDFNLKWDNINNEVYFDMPSGYTALFGHYLQISYILQPTPMVSINKSGSYEPLTPIICKCNFVLGNGEMSDVRVENNGQKITLVDLTYDNYTSYTSNSLVVETIYEIGNSFGWVTRRQDTQRNIDVPFDFRGRKYRRYGINLTSLNSDLGLGIYSIGDNYSGITSNSTYYDYPIFGVYDYSGVIFDIKIDGSGGPELGKHRGFNDNFITSSQEFYKVNIKGLTWNNTITGPFYNNDIGYGFIGNIVQSNFRNNKIGNSFRDNLIADSFRSNVIQDDYSNNRIGRSFRANMISDGFQFNNIKRNFRNNQIFENFNSNTILSNNFRENFIGKNFTNNILYEVTNNKIDSNFQFNTGSTTILTQNEIAVSFSNNLISGGVFSKNKIFSVFNVNNITGTFINNKINYPFQQNVITSSFPSSFNRNTINDSIVNVNFSTASHVYGDYNCEIFRNFSGGTRLSYYDSSDILTITGVTS